MQKVLVNNPDLQVSLNEAAGVVSLVVSSSVSMGGGSVAGALKAKMSAEVDLSAQVLIDAALDLAAAKMPSIAAEIMAAKALVDAEIAKA